MAILAVVFEAEAFGSLSLEKREFNVVGKEEELVWVGHCAGWAVGVGGCDVYAFSGER